MPLYQLFTNNGYVGAAAGTFLENETMLIMGRIVAHRIPIIDQRTRPRSALLC